MNRRETFISEIGRTLRALDPKQLLWHYDEEAGVWRMGSSIFSTSATPTDEERLLTKTAHLARLYYDEIQHQKEVNDQLDEMLTTIEGIVNQPYNPEKRMQFEMCLQSIRNRLLILRWARQQREKEIENEI